MSKPIVAIVGRPNVGKSTLFNRIVGQRVAIVEDKPGVTRDRLYQTAEWNGREFKLVDTGGLTLGEKEDALIASVREQVKIAIQESDVIIFLVDARQGFVPGDEEIASLLRRAKKPVLLVANKVDNINDQAGYMEFYGLGLGEPIPISAAQGLNIGDLLDMVVESLPQSDSKRGQDDPVRIAVVGRPNVGKSSLVNALLGEERVIVSDIPGTTRDAIDSAFTRAGKSYILVDTAGIRRKSRIYESTERYSVNRALKAVERCDVALLIIDAVEGVTEQDKRIAGYAHDKGKASVLTINKWDLVPKDDKTATRFTAYVRYNLAFLSYAPVVFTSALTKRGIGRLLNIVDYVAEQAAMHIPTSRLNELVEQAVLSNPPPAKKGKSLKLYYVTQAGVQPPTFIIFVNDPELVHFSYTRYLENQFRNAFGFEGTPLKFVFRKKKQ